MLRLKDGTELLKIIAFEVAKIARKDGLIAEESLIFVTLEPIPDSEFPLNDTLEIEMEFIVFDVIHKVEPLPDNHQHYQVLLSVTITPTMCNHSVIE